MDKQKYQSLEAQYNETTDERKKIELLVTLTLEVRNSEPTKALLMAENIIRDAKK